MFWFVIVTVLRTLGWFIAWNYVIVEVTSFGRFEVGDALLMALCYGLITATVDLPPRPEDENDGQ
jgi:hypothetical protein